ncbi:MAG: toll/interleukin-1 receptor domain-containing protein [Lewinellaceae bacterium]|nr:toll/interleukin-1 receptor domain-containing protein [Lewinellaceae bacterium]
MPSIFISYRRADTLNDAEKLFSALENHFGENSTFYDIQNLQGGMDWPLELEKKVQAAKVVLVLYGGPNWLSIDQWGKKRIDDPTDWVRKEIETALGSSALIIPGVVKNAQLPPEDILPNALKPLLKKQTCILRDGKWSDDLPALFAAIEGIIPKSGGAGQRKADFQFDPLANLPIDAGIAVPAHPFKGLPRFTMEDARIFFGRNQEIRDLYELLQNPYKRLILFYGQSGTGKSSLLSAGVLPRLLTDWMVDVKSRRSDGNLESIVACFRQRINTEKPEQPLLIIDQVEEIFIDRDSLNANEQTALADALNQMLADFPNLRIILSFREEYLARIRELLKVNPSYFDFYFLPMKEEALLEAITGVSSDPKLSAYYQHLSFEKNLPKSIASDLLNSEDEVCTPLLQVLLRNLWDKSVPENGKIYITKQFYNQQKKSSLKDFFDQQMLELSERYPREIKNGLVLDVLHLFITTDGTAGAFSTIELAVIYSHIWGKVERILIELQNRFLLSVYSGDKDEISYRLTHDALAPIILDKFIHADTLAQKARRSIENARINFAIFSKQELFTIVDAKDWMRQPSNIETELLEENKNRLLKPLVKYKISQNKIEEAIEMLGAYYTQKNLQNELHDLGVLKMQLDNARTEFIKDEIETENFSIRKNQIKDLLLQWSDAIDTFDFEKLAKEFFQNIIEADLQHAIKVVLEITDALDLPKASNSANLQMSRWHDNEEYFNLGVVSEEDYLVTKAQIAHGAFYVYTEATEQLTPKVRSQPEEQELAAIYTQFTTISEDNQYENALMAVHDFVLKYPYTMMSSLPIILHNISAIKQLRSADPSFYFNFPKFKQSMFYLMKELEAVLTIVKEEPIGDMGQVLKDISQSELKSAIQKLIYLARNNTAWEFKLNDLLLNSSSLESLEQAHRSQLIKYDFYSREHAKISQTVLEIYEELKALGEGPQDEASNP